MMMIRVGIPASPEYVFSQVSTEITSSHPLMICNIDRKSAGTRGGLVAEREGNPAVHYFVKDNSQNGRDCPYQKCKDECAANTQSDLPR